MKSVHAALLFGLLGVAACLFERKFIFVGKSKPWTSAQAYCRQNYVDLSTISKRGDLNKIRNMEHYTIQSWIGLTKSYEWYSQWSDGTELTFIAWASGEPYNLHENNCVSLLDSLYYNNNCSLSMPFYCYYWRPQIIVVNEMMDWEGALMYCRSNYEDLLGIDTETDMLAVNHSLINQTTTVWTGLRFMAGLWFWVNNGLLSNLTLLPSCPARPFQCGAITPDKVFEIRDCNEKMNFLCYKAEV
ncbi:macrophage mannose receptor 1-like [Tachysurus fulvidraco]|uniref:macrophage mannose receptor 1-like n=1 Tax=Tachysurus fulvidraco TaxID=1234273 RepID=UPI000F4EDA8F|nr:macrophage mannose receptor 1-like [Tachysurus fulvidraco]